jgi:hypothetical protein
VSAIVLIGPSDVLVRLRKQLDTDSPVQTFTDHDVREAVEYIATKKPAVVAIDEDFAVSPRGEALVGRILDDPGLSACEIRILPRAPKTEQEPTTIKSGTGITPDAPAPLVAPTLDRHGTRRAPRVRLIEGLMLTVDGNAAELVDLSANGAQVLSRIVLRPNQRVRVALPDGKRALRCAGAVVWASFEMPPGQSPRYRAGLKLSGIEADAIEGFAARHKAPDSPEPD